jgi:hypothetical protein
MPHLIHLSWYITRTITHLLDPTRSAVLISSATIARKSKMCSVGAPRPDRAVTHAMIQLGHCDGCPGASLSARDES